MSDGTNVKLSFEGLVPNGNYFYDLSNYNGYQGFNFSDMDLITRQGIQHHDWMDTGYGSVLHGDAEAFTVGVQTEFGSYGWIASSYSGETFNLKSGIFAAARYSYGYLAVHFLSYQADGHRKAEVTVRLTETATTINFANYGRDFKNIAAVQINAVDGSGGYISNVAMDNLKAHWNGAIPGFGAMRHHVHVSHPVLAAMAAQDHQASGHATGADVDMQIHHNASNHGELASLLALAHHGGGLTSEFSLPQAEHIGT